MNLLDFIFPKFCVSCGKIGSYFCTQCVKTIEPIKSYESICPICEKSAIGGRTHPGCRNMYALDGLLSFFHYKNTMKKAIKSIKYQYVSHISKYVILSAHNSVNLLSTYPCLTDTIIVPIPLHSSRYRYRGFNQAELFAVQLAKIYHLRISRDMIQRIKATTPQVEMKNKSERLNNMKGMFEIKRGINVPRKIVLLDDVFTTGATMREAGRVLKKHGAEIVWGITIAR